MHSKVGAFNRTDRRLRHARFTSRSHHRIAVPLLPVHVSLGDMAYISIHNSSHDPEKT
jgi:hypothetical protein